MKDGEIGLYKDKNHVIRANIRNGDKGIAFEELLPEKFRGDGFDDAPISGFTQMVYLYLTTLDQWQAWQKEAAKQITTDGKPYKAITPPLDLKVLNLLCEDGAIDYQRLKELFLLIGPYYETKPAIGLVPEMLRRGYSDKEIDQMLALYARRNGKFPEGLDQCFIDLFIPPELDNRAQRIQPDKIEYALRWCRRPSDEPDLKQDNLLWNLNLRELGIVNRFGSVNRHIAKLAKDFIWADDTRDPDYFLLLDYLKPNWPSQPTKQKGQPIPKSYQQKLKKQNRKTGKIRRKKK